MSCLWGFDKRYLYIKATRDILFANQIHSSTPSCFGPHPPTLLKDQPKDYLPK